MIDNQLQRSPSSSRNAVGINNVGFRASHTFDAAGQLSELANFRLVGTTLVAATLLSDFRYGYDAAGSRTSVRELDGSRVTWSYDAATRLLAERRTGANAYTSTHVYDSAGNRLVELAGSTRTTWAYDAANQLRFADAGSRSTFTFDAVGNRRAVQTGTSRTTYSWDAENRLVQAAGGSGLGWSGLTTNDWASLSTDAWASLSVSSALLSTFAYDGVGRRINNEALAQTRRAVWDSENVVAERDASGVLKEAFTMQPAEYGLLTSARRDGITEWPLFDGIGSVERSCDSSGNVTSQSVYSAYGKLIASGAAASSDGWLGRYGYKYHASSGLYYVRARWYDASTGVWLSADPIGFAGGDANLYRYVSDD